MSIRYPAAASAAFEARLAVAAGEIEAGGRDGGRVRTTSGNETLAAARTDPDVLEAGRARRLRGAGGRPRRPAGLGPNPRENRPRRHGGSSRPAPFGRTAGQVDRLRLDRDDGREDRHVAEPLQRRRRAVAVLGRAGDEHAHRGVSRPFSAGRGASALARRLRSCPASCPIRSAVFDRARGLDLDGLRSVGREQLARGTESPRRRCAHGRRSGCGRSRRAR